MTEELFSKAARQVLENLKQGELTNSLEASYVHAQQYLEEDIIYGIPEDLSEEERAQNNLNLLKQGLCYRAMSLVRSEISLIESHNLLGLALITRGHIETTAQLGYFCDRLFSLKQGNITFDSFHKKLAETLMGASHEMFTSAPKPLNILKCLEKADKHFARLSGEENQKMLYDCYSWLSDYCHPNFLSSASSYVLDRSTGTMRFSHGEGLHEDDMDLVGYLDISCVAFNMFFDDMLEREKVLTE